MSCPADRAPFRCPTEPEVRDQLLALLPSGRAWNNDDGGPRPDTTLWRWFASLAAMVWWAASRLCALRLEFWCASHSETHDLWMAEYGLPDLCDPFPDLCIKVSALGGTRCDYYQAIAARMGWAIRCIVDNRCVQFVNGRRLAGRLRAGGRRGPAHVVVEVTLDESPAFNGTRRSVARAGRFRAGQRLSCGPDIRPLKCLMARIVHADVETIYEVI